MTDWFDRIRLGIRIPVIVERLLTPYQRRSLNSIGRFSHVKVGRRLLLDVSIISRHDAGTGIQRVVRAIFNELQANVGERFILCPVAATRKRSYSHVTWNGAGNSEEIGSRVNVKPGDVFLGLDFSTHAVARHYRQLADWKQRGARLYFIVHDLLPEQYPDWFSTAAVLAYRRWIKAVALLADCVFCNSDDTEERFFAHCKDRYALLRDDLHTLVLPMGWDIASTTPTTGFSSDYQAVLSEIGRRSSILMVGTLEPRKGHAQVLDAFEKLWLSGQDCNLVIVGRSGWKTDSLQNRIREHSEFGYRLFWLADASDEALIGLYKNCHGVIIASMAEGYGLPMIEAIGYRKPILARELPVFREQAEKTGVGHRHSSISAHDKFGGNVAHSFIGTEEININSTVAPIEFFATYRNDELASILNDWINRVRYSPVRFSSSSVFPTWNDTAIALLGALDSDFCPVDLSCEEDEISHA